MAKKKADILDLPVTYGNISIGDKTARIGCTIPRSAITLSQADKTFTDRRLSGTVIAKPEGWSADQGALPGLGDDREVEGVFDVKGLSVSGDHYGIGLTFSRKDLDLPTLSDFAKREGRLEISGVEAIPEAEKNGETEE